MTVGPPPAALDPGQPEVDGAGLGRLTHVAQPREVWLTEAGHFTPWLADNHDVLAERMGLSLTLTATEVPVGECLGQLLVYASGLEAVIVVWVAPAFRDDHRRTLDWLNERTDEGVSFFGVEPARSSDITYAFASGTAALEATEAADIYDREAATDRSAAIDRLLADQGVTVVAACDQGRGRATCCSRLSRRVE